MSQTETPSAGYDARRRSAAVLRALKAYRRVSDEQLAVGIGASRSKVQGYMGAKSQLTIELMYDFARALGVQPVVFLMTPDEALGWVIENSPNGDATYGVPLRGRDSNSQPSGLGHEEWLYVAA